MTGWKVEYSNTASGSLMIIDEFSQWLAPCEIAQEVESFADTRTDCDCAWGEDPAGIVYYFALENDEWNYYVIDED